MLRPAHTVMTLFFSVWFWSWSYWSVSQYLPHWQMWSVTCQLWGCMDFCMCGGYVLVQAVLLSDFLPVSDLFSECSGEHCVLSQATWVLQMPCCGRQIPALLSVGGCTRAPGSGWESSQLPPLPAQAKTDVVRNTKWSRAATYGALDQTLTLLICYSSVVHPRNLSMA